MAINPTTLQSPSRWWDKGQKERLLLDISTYRAYPCLKNSMTLGRSDQADICLVDLNISRTHAALTEKGGAFYIQDLNSTYGTRINGKIISKLHKMEHTDLIQLGNVILKYFEVPYEERDFLPFSPPLTPSPLLIEDIKVLLDHLIGGAREYTPEFYLPLIYYPWEGNIRSLEFEIKNALIACPANTKLTYHHLRQKIRDHFFELMEGGQAKVFDIAKADLIECLKSVGGNVSQAIKKLGLSRKKIYQILKEYRIDPESYRKS